MKRLVFSMVLFLSFINYSHRCSGQTFDCYISNDHLTSSTEFEFDIYIISTSVDFNFRSFQSCLFFNPAFIPLAATVTASFVSGSTQLNNFTPGLITWSSTGYGFQSSTNTGVTCANGTLITTTTPVRIGTFRLVSSLPFNCAPGNPTMVGPSDPLPPGLSLRMAVTCWSTIDCSIPTSTTISSNGTYSQFPNSAYDEVNNLRPLINSQPQPATNCAGSGFATFSVSASSAPFVTTALSYQWLENGNPISNGSTPNGTYSGATSNTLTITSPGATLNGNLYSCIVVQCNADTTQEVLFTLSNPDDNNVCTIDQCDPLSGALTHTPVNVDDGNPCTTDACNSVTGVFHTATNTDDSNACTTDGCNTVTGVFHTPVNTSDNNACTVDACNTVSGSITHTAVNTNDNNACTTDGCNTVTGVFHTAVNINDNDACTTDACDSLSGAVTHTSVNVNDNNACTTDGCNSISGIFHTLININDGDPCTIDACNSISGAITHTFSQPSAPAILTNDGCGSTTLIALAPAGNFLWSTSDTTASITVTIPGVYTVTVSVNGCMSVPSISLASPLPNPVVYIGNDTVLAAGSSLVLDAGPGFNNYLWSTTDTAQAITVNTSDTYFITVTDSNGCAATDSIVVTFSTGVFDFNSLSLGLYPNPAENFLFLEVNGRLKIDAIRIFNSLGQEQKADFLELNAYQSRLNISELISGVYLLEIISGNEKMRGKFVKQ